MTAALSARFSELPLRLYVSWGVSLADVRTFVNEGGSRLIIRLARGHPSYELLLRARQRILALAAEPHRA